MRGVSCPSAPPSSQEGLWDSLSTGSVTGPLRQMDTCVCGQTLLVWPLTAPWKRNGKGRTGYLWLVKGQVSGLQSAQTQDV